MNGSIKTVGICAAVGILISITAAAEGQTGTAPVVAAKPARLSSKTPAEVVEADPAAKAVLDRDLPGLTAHPMYASVKSMGLDQIAAMSNGLITDAMIAKLNADLAALPR